MRRVGLIDITVGDAPRRIATFHHATLRVAPHRYATLEPLGKPGGSRAFSAAELDEQDPWAHVALGYLAFTARQTDEAIDCFRRALDLNPNFAAAHGYIGFALACDGRSEDAIDILQRAIRMSPRDPLNFFFVRGLRPGSPSGHRILCASLAQAGLIEEARAAMRLLRQVQPNISVAWIKASVPYTDHTMPRFLEGLRQAGLSD